MTTQSWSALIDHTSDAGFRAWGSDYAAKLAAIGLVKTSDTGQINWATVTRPGTNTAAGYEIWRFDDSLQGTSPIFIKIEYGTCANASTPDLWITAGTGSNGSGTITGNVTSRFQLWSSGTATSASSLPSYFCATEGFAGCAFRVGMVPNSALSWNIVRYSDDDGTPNGDGFTLHAMNGVTTALTFAAVQSVRIAATATVFGASTAQYSGVFPNGVGSSSADASGNLQVIPFWTRTPTFQQEFAVGGYLSSEISQGSTASITLKGSTARTFIALGTALGYGGTGAGSDSRWLMLWE